MREAYLRPGRSQDTGDWRSWPPTPRSGKRCWSGTRYGASSLGAGRSGGSHGPVRRTARGVAEPLELLVSRSGAIPCRRDWRCSGSSTSHSCGPPLPACTIPESRPKNCGRWWMILIFGWSYAQASVRPPGPRTRVWRLPRIDLTSPAGSASLTVRPSRIRKGSECRSIAYPTQPLCHVYSVTGTQGISHRWPGSR